MWGFVGAKATERWLWYAIDHHTGQVLAYVVGTRKDAEFLKLHALLAPLGITHYYTDKAGVYQRHLPPAQHTVGKLTMQKIERKHQPAAPRCKPLCKHLHAREEGGQGSACYPPKSRVLEAAPRDTGATW